MAIRRVITGHNDQGEAVVVHDERFPSATPDFAHYPVWGAEEPPVFPDDGRLPSGVDGLVPAPGGLRLRVRVRVVSVPPHFSADDLFDTDDPQSMAEAARAQFAAGPGVLADSNPLGAWGMHATASVDCVMQISGESVLLMEGSEVRLRAGDWLVVNGVTHSWRNDGDEPSVMLTIAYGAHHHGVPLRTR
ncbi:cupin domain-containing protein [Streptomyces sp. HMX112]|uniref:cupin domain-containing protein n=1 Tax=Streptomyces sp. HMX112 TaxID=3390850 RepID=UPI003A811D59